MRHLEDEALPAGDVVVDIDWADLNYKDGLCLTGAGGIVRTYPHVAGIDFAGTVSSSTDGRYRPGDAVVLTGWRVGETHWGGYAEKARVKADWLVPMPAGLDSRKAMVIGTAGLTAMLAIDRLEQLGLDSARVRSSSPAPLRGVGSVAVALLARLGYSVAALSGRPEHADSLRALGATTIVDRAAFLAEADKPLEVPAGPACRRLRRRQCTGQGAAPGRLWRLRRQPRQCRRHRARHQRPALPPARVNLLGIDSVMQPYERRVAAWARIATLFDFDAYAAWSRTSPSKPSPTPRPASSPARSAAASSSTPH